MDPHTYGVCPVDPSGELSGKGPPSGQVVTGTRSISRYTVACLTHGPRACLPRHLLESSGAHACTLTAFVSPRATATHGSHRAKTPADIGVVTVPATSVQALGDEPSLLDEGVPRQLRTSGVLGERLLAHRAVDAAAPRTAFPRRPRDHSLRHSPRGSPGRASLG